MSFESLVMQIDVTRTDSHNYHRYHVWVTIKLLVIIIIIKEGQKTNYRVRSSLEVKNNAYTGDFFLTNTSDSDHYLVMYRIIKNFPGLNFFFFYCVSLVSDNFITQEHWVEGKFFFDILRLSNVSAAKFCIFFIM